MMPFSKFEGSGLINNKQLLSMFLFFKNQIVDFRWKSYKAGLPRPEMIKT